MGGRSKQVRNALKKTGLPEPMPIPCKKGHTHDWPTQGPISKDDIGRCQVVCQFCSAKSEYVEAKWPWHLRRHVWDMHRQDYPELIIPPEWSGKKQYSKGAVGPAPSGKTTKREAKTTLRANDSAAAAPSSSMMSLQQDVAPGAVMPASQLDFGNFNFLPAPSTELFDPQEMIDAAMGYTRPASSQLASSESGASANDIDLDAMVAETALPAGEFALQSYDQPAAAPAADDSILCELFPELDLPGPFAAAGFDQNLSLPGFTAFDFDLAVAGY